MSAPASRTSRQCTPFMAPWVPTGMKAGVRTMPCGVAISPTRAAPSVPVRRKEKGSDIGLRYQAGTANSKQAAAVSGPRSVSRRAGSGPEVPVDAGADHVRAERNAVVEVRIGVVDAPDVRPV